MNGIVKFLTDIFIVNFLTDIFGKIRDIFTPPKAFSWKTLILLSLFSWIMSLMAGQWVENLLSTFGWFFLIFGTAWGTSENKVKPGGFDIGPWITGALVSIFLFGSWNDRIPPISIITWPTISAVIATVPHFISSGKLRTPPLHKRQELIVLIGSNLLITCWLRFHYLVQDWLHQYPSLLVDNFNQSTFVVRLDSPDPKPMTGMKILDGLGTAVKNELANQPWPQVERWLLEAQNRIRKLGQQVIQKRLSNLEEKMMWRVEPRISKIRDGYNLQLTAIWNGPSSTLNGYSLTKSCLITQIQSGTGTPGTQVICNPVGPVTPVPKPIVKPNVDKKV